MPRKRAVRRTAAKKAGRTLAGKTVLAALALCLTASGLTLGGWGRPGSRDTAAKFVGNPPSPPLSSSTFSPASPSKEYVYAGGRLVATEEPASASALPAGPTNLTADFNNRLVSWTDNSSNESGFKIELRTRTGAVWAEWSQVQVVGPNVTSYSSLMKGCGLMEWRVRAYNAAGDSAYSNVAFACRWDYETSPTIYDAVADSSAAQNPSGAWGYGYRAAGGEAFTLFTGNSNVYGLPVGMRTWYLPGAWNLPAVIHNGTGVTQSYFGAAQPTDLLNLYPGASGELSVVRWTAQGPGTAQISGRFQGLDTTTTSVSVVKNGTTTLFSGSVTGLGSQAPFSSQFEAVAGDTVEFRVHYNGDIQHDSTGLAATVAVQGPPPPLTYNAVADFSASQNPSGPWGYGYRPANGGAFAVLASNSNVYGLPSGMHTWYLPGAWNLPAVIHNGTGSAQSYFGATQPVDLLNLYPGAGGERSVVRWTAPAAGTAQVTGRFQGLDATTTAVAVVRNGTTTLASGTVNGVGNQANFSLTVAVAAGETIEFQVYYNGDVQHDNTGLAAAITLQR